jgi:hypothetical protein
MMDNIGTKVEDWSALDRIGSCLSKIDRIKGTTDVVSALSYS